MGARRDCAFGSALIPLGEPYREARVEPPITVAFAAPKGDRLEWTVQKLTELGVDRIVVMRTDRSIVQWDAARGERQRQRWQRVAREAAMQSRRSWLPLVEGPLDAAVVLDWPGVALCESGGSPPSLHHPIMAIGAEGGWSDSERAKGRAFVGLGPNVLRIETAALAAGALLVALRSQLVISSPIAAESAVSG